MMFNTDLTRTINRARGQQLGDVLRRSAKRVPNKTALIFRGQTDTFVELDTAVNRAANGLAKRGIAKGDKVAILSHNNRAFVVLRFALARLGAVITPINFMLNAEDLAYMLDHSGAVMILCEDALCAVADDALAKLSSDDVQRIVIPHAEVATGSHWEPVDRMLDHSDDSEPWVEMNPNDPVQLIYTSGTESRSKGALQTADQLISQYVTCVVDGEMTADAIELHCLPLFHCAQLDCFLSPDIYLGATSIVHDKPDPAEMLSAVEAHKVTKLFCPPTIWIALLSHPDFDKHDLNSLKSGYYGASIMPTAVIEKLAERLPQMKLYNFYGQTEMAPVATILRPEDQLTKLGSAGRPGLNVETLVVDDDDNPLPVGEVGEIVHRSPHLILGYYNNLEKTAEAFRNGWFHSGDLGRFDEDGYLYVVDRKKDMIKTGGENVASREVEEIIIRHPAVAEVAVLGLPHPIWIEAVAAFAIPKSGSTLTPDELKAFCGERISGLKSPKYFKVVEALPKNASGKILKRDLRDTYSDVFAEGEWGL